MRVKACRRVTDKLRAANDQQKRRTKPGAAEQPAAPDTASLARIPDCDPGVILRGPEASRSRRSRRRRCFCGGSLYRWLGVSLGVVASRHLPRVGLRIGLELLGRDGLRLGVIFPIGGNLIVACRYSGWASGLRSRTSRGVNRCRRRTEFGDQLVSRRSMRGGCSGVWRLGDFRHAGRWRLLHGPCVIGQRSARDRNLLYRLTIPRIAVRLLHIDDGASRRCGRRLLSCAAGLAGRDLGMCGLVPGLIRLPDGLQFRRCHRAGTTGRDGGHGQRTTYRHQ